MLLALLTLAGAPPARPAGPATSLTEVEVAAWREDLAFMAAQMQRRHKNLFHSVSRDPRHIGGIIDGKNHAPGIAMKRTAFVLTSVLWAAGATACAGPDGPANGEQAVLAEAAAGAAPLPATEPATTNEGDRSHALPLVTVHKSPTCGCCNAWIEHMRRAGFEVEVRDTDDLNPIKQSLGVPADKASCHTAQVGNYFVEGHVPADDVKRLLAEQPDARGIAVPGMPAGSPGMEVPPGNEQPYSVELVSADGTSSTFARH